MPAQIPSHHVSCCAGKMVRQQCAPCEPGSPTDVKIRNGAGDGEDGEAQAAASSSPGNLYTLHMVMEDKHPTCRDTNGISRQPPPAL